MKTFRLTILSFNSSVYNGEAVFCSVQTPTGIIGLEAGHEPFLAVLLQNSRIFYRDPKGSENTVQIANGLLSFRKNHCTVTIERSQ